MLCLWASSLTWFGVADSLSLPVTCIALNLFMEMAPLDTPRALTAGGAGAGRCLQMSLSCFGTAGFLAAVTPQQLCAEPSMSYQFFFFFTPFVHLCDTAIMVCEYAARAFILGGFIITISSCWHCLCISLELVCLAGFLTGQSCLQACSWGDGRKYLALKLSLGQTLHPCVSRGSRAIPPLLLGSYFTFEWYKGSLVPWCNGIMEKQWDVKLFSFLSR